MLIASRDFLPGIKTGASYFDDPTLARTWVQAGGQISIGSMFLIAIWNSR
jgi:hypothetical protein